MMETREDINKSIEAFIKNCPPNYVFTPQDTVFLSQYDKCEDSDLNESTIFKTLWNRAMKMEEGFAAEDRFEGSVLVTHGGSGKAISSAPLGASFHVFNNDYFCHVITQELTSGRSEDNFMNYDFGTIAEYFYVGYLNALPSYDIAISYPPRQCGFAELDFEDEMASIAQTDARVYYAMRSFDLLRNGGRLFLIVKKSDFEEVFRSVIKELAAHRIGVDFDFQAPKLTGDEYLLEFRKL